MRGQRQHGSGQTGQWVNVSVQCAVGVLREFPSQVSQLTPAEDENVNRGVTSTRHLCFTLTDPTFCLITLTL